jgi:hypothetical protein
MNNNMHFDTNSTRNRWPARAQLGSRRSRRPLPAQDWTVPDALSQNRGCTANQRPAHKLIGKWTSNGSYSARSAHLATFQGSMTCLAWEQI